MERLERGDDPFFKAFVDGWEMIKGGDSWRLSNVLGWYGNGDWEGGSSISSWRGRRHRGLDGMSRFDAVRCDQASWRLIKLLFLQAAHQSGGRGGEHQMKEAAAGWNLRRRGQQSRDPAERDMEA